MRMRRAKKVVPVARKSLSVASSIPESTDDMNAVKSEFGDIQSESSTSGEGDLVMTLVSKEDDQQESSSSSKKRVKPEPETPNKSAVSPKKQKLSSNSSTASPSSIPVPKYIQTAVIPRPPPVNRYFPASVRALSFGQYLVVQGIEGIIRVIVYCTPDKKLYYEFSPPKESTCECNGCVAIIQGDPVKYENVKPATISMVTNVRGYRSITLKNIRHVCKPKDSWMEKMNAQIISRNNGKPNSDASVPKYFVAEGKHCIYYANYNEVEEGTVAEDSQVYCKIYGPSTVYFYDFDKEDEAKTAAKNYAETHNKPYGVRNERCILYEKLQQKEIIESKYLMQKMEELRTMNHKEITQLTTRVQQLTDQVAALRNKWNQAQPENPIIPEMPLLTLGISQEEIDECFNESSTHPNFTTLIFEKMFSDVELIKQKLPSNKLKEMEKICYLKYNCHTGDAILRMEKLIKELIITKRNNLRTRITRSIWTPAVAYADRAIPLRLRNGLYYPEDGVEYKRADNHQLQKWIILVDENKQPLDTIIAELVIPSAGKVRKWNYFIMSAAGELQRCKMP